MNDARDTSSPLLPPGTKVFYDGLVRAAPNWGIVPCWLNDKINAHEC